MDSKIRKSGSITNEFLRNLHFSGLKGKANFSSTTPQILTSKMKAYALIEENLELNCGVQDQVVKAHVSVDVRHQNLNNCSPNSINLYKTLRKYFKRHVKEIAWSVFIFAVP